MWIVGKFLKIIMVAGKIMFSSKTASGFFRERIVFCSAEYLDGLFEYER